MNRIKHMQKKALVLFSGGLDSILACKLLQQQDIEVTALSFRSYFFDTLKPEEMAKKNGITLMIRDISPAHLEVVKQPKHGYGAGLNPCIDCHKLMIKEALSIAEKEGYDMVATGEVLGQRPLSQNRRALELIERTLGAEKKILRPLSAQVLPPTLYEEQGWVKRDQLAGIMGRGRKKQIRIAQELGVQAFPNPGGGCILTEPDFAKRLKELLEKELQPTRSDYELVRFGRHFWEEAGNGIFAHIILGKNREENIKLEALASSDDLILKREDEKGPTAVVRRYYQHPTEEVLAKAKKYINLHSKSECEAWQMLQKN